jgi:hypothetical protein
MSHFTNQHCYQSARYNAFNSWNSNTLNLVNEELWD